MARRIGIYPGTFDPVTLGHQDMIRRAAAIVDCVVVAVAEDSTKTALFPVETRKTLLEREVALLRAGGGIPEGADVQVASFSGLLVRYARREGACMIIRGLRAVSDYDYEIQMAGVNARLEPFVQSVFLSASEDRQFIASRWVKEVARMGGDVGGMVSPHVAAALKARFGGEG
jgi:pantetheine-phosphate adenylyltransferase